MANYSLYARPAGSRPGSKWVRISGFAYPKAAAVRVYQTVLLCGYAGLSVRLRPVGPAEPLICDVDAARLALGLKVSVGESNLVGLYQKAGIA